MKYLILVLFLSSCASQYVMRDCEETNTPGVFICDEEVK